jgi:hypothetical protein
MPSGRKHITSVLEEETEAKEFIHGGKKTNDETHGHLATQKARGLDGQPSTARRKISIRIPQELDEMLSHVSLKRILAHRQGALSAEVPREKQDIMAEALRDWLEKLGYLSEKRS